jgi:trk system potassium uptake protein TrkH
MPVQDAIREAAFHVSSIITTTGYSISDYNLWPALSKTVIVILMCIGASAGSTGGGFKCARVLLLIKSMLRSLSQILRPQKVKVIRVNGKVVSEKILSNTATYLFIYVFIIIVSVLFISIDGFSLETNITAVLACFNNIGPGFDAVGPASNFGSFSIFSKIILTVAMLAGRLEIFPIILLLKKEAWKR